MKFLVFDTCGAQGMVAVGDGAGVRAAETLPGRGAAEQLVPAVERVLGVAGLVLGELAGVGVVHGPGSFTGVRVGLAAAKGLCEAGGLPMLAVSRLDLLAAAAGKREEPVLALLDAGRGEFFAGLYRGRAMVWERLLRREEVLEAMHQAVAAVSSEAAVVDGLVGQVTLLAEPEAALLLHLVAERAASGQWSDVALMEANYLRRPDAEIARAARS